MPNYKFRFSFDAGSGTCFWGADADTQAKYGYPVDNRQLHLRTNTYRGLLHLIAWYDTSINWDYPPDPSPWTSEEMEGFDRYKRSLLDAVRKELGAEYEIIAESQ